MFYKAAAEQVSQFTQRQQEQKPACVPKPLDQPWRSSTSTREMVVRVLPELVAITSSAFRRFSVSKAWQTVLHLPDHDRLH